MHLVDDYRPGTGFFFGTATRSLLTSGHDVVLPGRGGLAPARAEKVLQALGPGQMLVGAVPFDADSPAVLAVPSQSRWGPVLPPDPTSPAPQAVTATPEPAPDDYRTAVQKALKRIEDSELSKVVLARSLRIPVDDPVRIDHVLRRLRGRNGSGFVFAVELPAGRSLVGGSPELLVSRAGDVVCAHPLAGSRPRSDDSDENHRRGEELLASEKDRREHALTVDAVARALEPYCDQLEAPSRPDIVSTGHMLHLGTRVTGRLRAPRPSALQLAAAMHPTPAVCGVPRASARAAISELEGFDRDFYTGMVGWCDAAGNGEWAVTIRCAQVSAAEVRLFAGAGVVEGSTPDSELAETQAKLETMLTALGYRVKEDAHGRAVHPVA